MMIRDGIESMSSEGDEDESFATPLHDPPTTKKREGENGDSPSSHAPNNDREQLEIEEEKPKKSFVNKNLLPLKILLFVFYGGLGVLSTWLNHSLLTKRFTERETALAYGLAALLSIPVPFIFGLISDKSAQPKKILVASLLLAGLIYPLILTVPTAVSYHYEEKFAWCRETGRENNSCLPFVLKCTSGDAELITNYGICSQGCGGKLILTNCHYHHEKNAAFRSSPSTTGRNETKGDNVVDYDQSLGPSAAAQIQSDPALSESDDRDEGEDVRRDASPPHVCINSNSKKYKSLCKVFDKERKEIELDVSDVSGYTEINGDGMCHYPIHGKVRMAFKRKCVDNYGYLDEKETPQPLIFCPSLPPNSYVTCTPEWRHIGVDQWVCRDDYLTWLTAFSVFLVVHAFGTMLLISAAALLNSAMVSMVHQHEHGSYVGFQLIYGVIGFATLTPLTAFLFQYFQPSDPESSIFPWDLEYVLGFSVWFIIGGIIAAFLPYDAEWVPKTGTVRPMLAKWCLREQNLLFFHLLVTLGCLQGMMDVLAYYQIKATGGSLLVIGIGAAAAVAPALIFIFRVERVIDYCGYQNVLFIALVVASLQFTGYAYLEGVSPMWSYLMKGLDTFSVLMVWVTASLTTHNSAPRSLVATCQTVVVILYCCIGRGLGGVLCYFGLRFLSKEYLLKTCGTFTIFICILFLIIHYWCLKPVPYAKKFHIHEKPPYQGTTGNYKPLKLISKKEKAENEDDEL